MYVAEYVYVYVVQDAGPAAQLCCMLLRLSLFVFPSLSLFSCCICSAVSEETVCAGQGSTEARATEPKAMRNVERYRLLITRLRVAAFRYIAASGVCSVLYCCVVLYCSAPMKFYTVVYTV